MFLGGGRCFEGQDPAVVTNCDKDQKTRLFKGGFCSGLLVDPKENESLLEIYDSLDAEE